MEEKTTRAMQRVRDALLEGAAVPSDAQAALTDAERAELAALATTAVLTRQALQAAAPPETAAEASLRRAQDHLSGRPKPPVKPSPRSGIAGWFSRWRR